MDTKLLLTGIISFIAGALLVSTAATTFDKSKVNSDSMSSMVESLKDKSGDDFDAAFISEMIVHHQGAIDMARMAESRAKHDEMKQLSKNIVTAQEQEITQMKQWQTNWGYQNSGQTHTDSH